MKLAFYVPGIPIPQGSVRAFVRGGRAAVTSDNPALRSWRLDVTAAASAELGGREPFTGPVDVVLSFILPRPAGHFGKRGVLPSAPVFPGTKPDLDKLCRGILDALTGAGALRDDSQVVGLMATKHYAAPLLPPGVTVVVDETRP